MSGLVYSGGNTFNPYRHFGHPSLWPCGYPIEQLGFPTTDTYRVGSKWKTPLVQQGLVNGEPDLDAIFRLTRKWHDIPLELSFDPTPPPAILPEDVYSPINTQNTLFLKDAFWGLLLPTTKVFRIVDIWRGYWLQRLLWEVGGHVGFFPANVHHVRNAHNYMKDFEEDEEIYTSTFKLMSFLSKWSCPRELSFFRCMYLLSFEMGTAQFWGHADVDLTRRWIDDLISIGYPEPTRIATAAITSLFHQIFGSDLQMRKERYLSQGTEVTFFTDWSDAPLQVEERGVPFRSIADRRAYDAAAVCSSFSMIKSLKDFTKYNGRFFQTILLVVTMSGSINSQYVDSVLKSVVPTIVYCGRKADKIAMHKDPYFRERFTYIEILPHQKARIGSLRLWCALKALEMNYNVSGILVTGSDIILNFRKLQKLKAQRPWIDENTRSSSFKSAIPPQAEILDSALTDIFEDETIQPPLVSPKDFVSNLKKRRASSDGFHKSLAAQVFYIPRALFASFERFYKYFIRLGAIDSFALAWTINGLVNGEDLERLSSRDVASTNLSAPSFDVVQASHFMFNFSLTKRNKESLCRQGFFIQNLNY